MLPAENTLIAGVDEAGRGPWFGSVFAAAVILDPLNPVEGLGDSKVLSEKKRNALFSQIQLHATSWCIAEATAEEIDHLNILQATLLAMQRAVNGLSVKPESVVVDGNQCPKLTMPCQAIVKGDSKVAQISAASILAKVARDRVMEQCHNQYPQYAFHLHKGYGTKQHLAELQQFGVLPEHRKSFAPIKKLLKSGT